MRAGARIEDTSFLRVLAVRNSISLGLRYDTTHFYAAGELEGREDQTRRYEHLAWDALVSAETGIKILTREPQVSVGVQSQVSRRETRTGLPQDALALHQAERWRAELIADDDAATRFASAHPGVDTQRLRALVRSARKDAALVPENRSGRAFRELFQFVRDHNGSADA